jgi:hypothetical protein
MTAITALMESIPLWLLLLFTVALVLAASEIGHWLGVRRVRQQDPEGEGQVSSLTAAHLGLLAFIMAFTFGVAADLSMKRRALIMDEANAIQTAYQRAGLLEGPAASALQQLLIEYTDARADVTTVIRQQGAEAALKAAERMQDAMWDQVRALTRGDDVGELHGLLVESVDTLFSLHNNRVAAGMRVRIPPIIWVCLYLLLFLSMMGQGYFNGMKERRSPVATTSLAVSLSLVVILIVDLDRPAAGLIKSDQTAMREMSQRLSGSR